MARDAKAPLYPASLDLRGAPVLVVGGGAVAARKAGALLLAHAVVTVVAPAFHPAFARLARRPGLRQVRRRFRLSDLRIPRLVFAATDDAALNARIAADARRRGVWVNVAAPGECGDLQVPAAVRRGQVCIAISTGGASAALARTLRERLERAIGPEWGQFAALLEQRRERVLRGVADKSARRRLLKALGSPRFSELIRQRGARRAARDMDRLIAGAVRAADTAGTGRAARQARRKREVLP